MTTTKIILENEQEEVITKLNPIFNKNPKDLTEEERRIADEVIEDMLEEVDEFITSYLNS